MKFQMLNPGRKKVVISRLMLPLAVFVFTSFILVMVQWKVQNPMLLPCAHLNIIHYF